MAGQQDNSSSSIKGKGKQRDKDKDRDKDRDADVDTTVDGDRDNTAYKRKRSSKACVVCRQKKVRCSGTDPCRHCIEFGESCIFDESQVQSTKTLSDLQLRIKRLEECVVQLRNGKELPLLSSIGSELESLSAGLAGGSSGGGAASAGDPSSFSYAFDGNSNGTNRGGHHRATSLSSSATTPAPGGLPSASSTPSTTLPGILKRIGSDRDSVELKAPGLPSLFNGLGRQDPSPASVPASASILASSTALTTAAPIPVARKRARIDEDATEVVYIDDDDKSPLSSTAHRGRSEFRALSPTEAQRAFAEEAKHLGTLGKQVPAVMGFKPVKHPSTSKVRPTGESIPPEEMYSTDEDGPHQDMETSPPSGGGAAGGVGSAKRDTLSGAYHAGRDSPVIPVDMHTGRGASRTTSATDSNTPGSGSGSGNSNGQSSPSAVASEMQRSDSSSSGGAAGIQSLLNIGPAVAKISSSPATELRFDLKGNLRYLGPASTSAVVAELADRQRWDVEFPVRSLALAQRQRASSGHPTAGAGAPVAAAAAQNAGSNTSASPSAAGANGGSGGGGGGGGGSSPSMSPPGIVNDGEINPNINNTAPTSANANSGPQTSSEFIAPQSRPKPWEIFSNLGVTVEAALPPVGDVELPDIDLCIKLVNTFFDVIHPIFPVLHKTTFSSDVTRIYNLKEKGMLGPADAPFLTLFFALLACASLAVDDPGVFAEGGYGANARTFPAEPVQVRNHYAGTTHASTRSTRTRTRTYNFGLSDAARKQGVERPGHRFYAQCNIIILHSLFQPSVDQAVLYGLMAFFHVGSNAAARAWILSGQALRLAIELGLHRSSVGFKPYNRERRRRVFWSLFNLESLLANNLGRPPSLPLYEIDQERPEDLCLDDLMPSAMFGPPRKGNLAGFLHITQLHFLTAEVMRTISRHQRLIKPISVDELQKRLLKYEIDLQKWYLSAPDDLRGPASELEPCHRLVRYIMICAYPSVLLLLFMPFMPRRGEEATEFQTYALTRCVFACKDHVTFSKIYQAPIPPGHYLFNLTQHLLVSGALLLLICHRGLQDPKLLDLTVQDVDACIDMLVKIGQRFVGGIASAKMLLNMKDNMKHSETWKLRDQRILLEKSGVQYPYSTPGATNPPMPTLEPKKMPGVIQPCSDLEISKTDHHMEEEDGIGEEVPPTPPARASSVSAIRSTTTEPAVPRSMPTFAQPTSNSAGPVAQYTSVMGYQPSGAQTLANAPNASYYTMANPSNQQMDLQQQHQYAYSDLSGYSNMGGMNTGSGLVAGVAPPQIFLNGMSMNNSPRGDEMYAYQTGDPNTANYMQPSYSMMYNTVQGQPLWPSDNFNFAIEGLDEIAAKSHSDFLQGTQFQDQFAFFQ